MYIDLEGVNLCREASLSIHTLLIDTGIPTIRVCLIDIYLLGSQAFNTTGIKGKTPKDIFQDEKITKVFFDVRNDSDALFALGLELILKLSHAIEISVFGSS
jgi:exonuclease 3'-5' domain-containing protein 1